MGINHIILKIKRLDSLSLLEAQKWINKLTVINYTRMKTVSSLVSAQRSAKTWNAHRILAHPNAGQGFPDSHDFAGENHTKKTFKSDNTISWYIAEVIVMAHKNGVCVCVCFCVKELALDSTILETTNTSIIDYSKVLDCIFSLYF